MDAIHFITDMLSKPALLQFIAENVPADTRNYFAIKTKVCELRKFMMNSKKFRVLPAGDQNQGKIKNVRLTAQKLGNLMSEIVGRASRKQSSSSGSHDLVKDWKETLDLINGMLQANNYYMPTENQLSFNYAKLLGYFFDIIKIIKKIENMILETADASNCITLNEGQSQALFLMKAFPSFGEDHIGSSRKSELFDELIKELNDLPYLICKAFEEHPLALVLIGGLLSFKPMAYETWNRVKNDLGKIKESNDHMGQIITYCYNDLPYFLEQCFLYLACYPIDYEIPVTSLINIWIAEGFIEQEDGESIETTANKYLKELIQRSLVYVSKISFLGKIKSCRVPRSIHKFAIQQSCMNEFLVANPDQEENKSLFRLAINQDNKNRYTEVKHNPTHSYLAFDINRNILGSAMFLRVLELRKSAIPATTLPNMTYLRYLGLRGSNISNLPQNIGDMKNLQTLDVRDTSIETLPESLWNITKLRHVYVKPTPQIKGPPSAANISDLQILKTVVAHESWVENIPHFLTNLTKLGLSNWDNLDCKYISNLLSHMDKLISLAIMSNIIPSESIDTRAFPNLETVKSIKLEGKWICRKLFIDYVKFPPNLTKLTLTNSGLKEDPMPTLERLQALKFLILQDEAYIGNQMVCSQYGFPQLQFLKLKKLENLENWKVQRNAMSQLTTVRVVQCRKLKNLPSLWRGTITHIDD